MHKVIFIKIIFLKFFMMSFTIKTQVQYGTCIYIVHSLNDWSIEEPIKLKYTEVNFLII
jgi:hypothetical protein